MTLFAIGGKSDASSVNSSTSKSTKSDAARGKRQLSYARLTQPRIDRRISTGFYNTDPQQASYYPSNDASDLYQQADYSQGQQTYYNGQPQQYPQYIEAPEPIIEIIIKESNDTIELPPQETIALPGKKKKEQVQVFYVKYQNDPHKGVIIEDPVAALSPGAYHQENEDYEEELPQNDQQQPQFVTLPPPVKTTTLRTIIRPDSEKFHSNSGIHVTFGTEDKSQQGHQLQEEKVESALQPVVALPTATIAPDTSGHQHHNDNHHHYQHHPNQHKFHENKPVFVQQQAFQNHAQNNEFHSRFGQQARYYNTNNNNEVYPPLGQGLVNGHQQLPFVNSPSQPFRSAGSSQPAQVSQQFPKPTFNAQPTNYPRPQFQQRAPDQDRNSVGSSSTPFVQQLPSFAPPPPFRNVPQQGPPQLPPPVGFNSNQQQRPHGPPAGHFNQPPTATPVRFPSGAPASPYQAQQQKYHPSQIPIPSSPPQPPQHRPIPIPLHQFDQQKVQNLHLGPPNYQTQQFNGQNNHQFRPREPLQIPVNNAKPFNNFNVQPSVTPIQGGGLVQQPAPNLSREQPQPHHQLQVQQQSQQFQNNNQQNQQFQNNHQQNPQFQNNNQQNLQFQNNQQQSQRFQNNQQSSNPILSSIDDIASGGELIQSVAKYEQHIIEQAPQFHVAHQQQVNYSPIPSSTPSIGPKQNIGPLANTIGHLNHFPSSTVAPLRPSQPEVQQFDSSVHNQQFIQQQISQILQEPQQQQQQAQIQPQIIPNSQPVHPGQSVSTHYTENFPTLEQQRQQYYKSFISNQPQDQLQQVISINGRNNANSQGQIYESSSIYTPTTYSTTTPRVVATSPSISSTTTSQQSTTTTQRPVNKKSNVILPDEVPDDLRQQLFSSGILDNADISVLDYDKIGSTNLENLPQEHLANFFSAGGGAQIASSNKVLTVVKPNGEKVNLDYNDKEKLHTKKTLDKTLPQKQNVDLKVVRFDSTNQKSVSDQYIKSDAAVLPTVEINTGNHQYNRYLPLKLNGAQFPIPDVPELRGKRIASVVVLAPVDNSLNNEEEDEGRYERDVAESKHVKFIAGDALKQLIKKPTKENFKRWLEKEANTEIDFQSVVLLVAK